MATPEKRKLSSIETAFNVAHMPKTKARMLYHAKRCAPGQAPLEKLPLELITMIFNGLAVNDSLSLNLTSRTIASYLRKADGSKFFDNSSLNRDERRALSSICHSRLEKDIPNGVFPSLMYCHDCCKYHDRGSFADSEWRVRKRSRCCLVSGGLKHGIFGGRKRGSLMTTRELMTIDKVRHFQCTFCKNFIPKAQHAEKKDVRAYMVLAGPWEDEPELGPNCCQKCLREALGLELGSGGQPRNPRQICFLLGKMDWWKTALAAEVFSGLFANVLPPILPDASEAEPERGSEAEESVEACARSEASVRQLGSFLEADEASMATFMADFGFAGLEAEYEASEEYSQGI